MNVDLGYRPRAWQLQCHTNRRRFTVLALHRRAGKTELAIMELISRALTFRLDLGFFAYVSPFLKQSKQNVWARLKSRLEPLRTAQGCTFNEVDLSVTFASNKATIRIFGGDAPDALRGIRLDGVVVDEVAQVKPELWEEVVRPALADRKGWALFIGTPKGSNLFSKLYFKAVDDPEWYRAVFTVYDTDALDAGEVAAAKRSMSELTFAREFLCDFTASGDDQVISLADVEESAQRAYKPNDFDYAPVIIGVDPARFGDDRSTIVRRQGLQVFDPIVINGIDNMALAAKVASEIVKHKPDAVFIDAGNGSGVIDRLRQLGHDVVEVHFGGKADQAMYANKAAEMLFTLRDWMRAGGAIPNNQDLKQDLAVRVYWYDNANRIVLEPKADVKKRGMPSPDLADAMALTFAHPVTKHVPGPAWANRDYSKRDYDPVHWSSDITAKSMAYDPLSMI